VPRVYTSASDPLDFCRACFPREIVADRVYGAMGDGPDGGNCFAWDAEHPPYGGEGYRCEECDEDLTDEDN
jgi:hypothetical protein